MTDAPGDDTSPAEAPAPEGPGDVLRRAWTVSTDVFRKAHAINLLAAVVVAELVVIGFMSGSTYIVEVGVESTPGPLALGIAGTGALLGVALNLLLVSLARPLRLLFYRGPEAVSTIREALSIATERIFHVLGVAILWSLLFVVGLVFCIVPGILVAMGSWVPMYTAATTDLGVTDVIRESIQVLRRQWLSIFLLVVVTGAASGAVYSPTGCIRAIPVAGLILEAAIWAAISTVLWIWSFGAMVAIEERDRTIYNTGIWDDPLPETDRDRAPASDVSTAATDDGSSPGSDGESDAEDVEW